MTIPAYKGVFGITTNIAPVFDMIKPIRITNITLGIATLDALMMTYTVVQQMKW